MGELIEESTSLSLQSFGQTTTAWLSWLWKRRALFRVTLAS